MTKRIDMETVDEATQCPECGSAQLARDDGRGERVCQRCGLVLEQALIDQGPEWRAFDAEQREKRARTGAPMTLTLHDKGLSTEIGWNNKDSHGKSIPAANRAQLFRLRRWHRRIRATTALERNLVFALGELDRMASRMGLARTVRETAAMVYRRAVQANLIRGRSIEGVAAASLYAACRQCGVPRTLDEIAEASRVSRKEVGRTFRFLARELKLRLPPTGPESYLARFCSELRLSGAIHAQAEALLRQATAKGLTNGKGPMGVAAATVYIASILGNDRRTQEEVAAVSGVTEVTIRNRYKELAQRLELPARGLQAKEGPSPAKVPLERVLHPLLGELHKNPVPKRVTQEERLAEEFVRRPRQPPRREVAPPA